MYLSYWSFAAALVTIVMVVVGPVIGSISDRRGYRKPIFVALVLMGSLSCIAMGLPTWWVAFLMIYIMGKIAFNSSLVLYDSMLNDITTYERMDTVSSKGYAVGYIGSCIPFAACLVFIIMSDMMDESSSLSFETAVMISLIITGVWWFVVSLPLIKKYEQVNYNAVVSETIGGKMSKFVETLKEILDNPAMLLFLLAFFFYIDGVNTIIDLAIAYGEALELGSVGLLGAMLVMQITAFPCTMFMSRMAKKYGAHRIIMVSIFGYAVASFYAIFLDSIAGFFFVAILVGFFQGTIQALSRSYFARMVPKDKTGEYFGIMDVFGKGATIIGTLAIAILTSFFGEIRLLAYVLLAIFIIGGFLLSQSFKIKVYDVTE